MKFSEDQMVQRDHNFSIVDEIDSCLIDEARTPLIISGAAEDRPSQYMAIDKLIKNSCQDSLIENISCKNALKVSHICANIFDNN